MTPEETQRAIADRLYGVLAFSQGDREWHDGECWLAVAREAIAIAESLARTAEGRALKLAKDLLEEMARREAELQGKPLDFVADIEQRPLPWEEVMGKSARPHRVEAMTPEETYRAEMAEAEMRAARAVRRWLGARANNVGDSEAIEELEDKDDESLQRIIWEMKG